MSGYIFSDCQNISDVRKVIESKSDYLLAFDTYQLKYHFSSLNHIDSGKEEKFMNLVHRMDHLFSPRGLKIKTSQKISSVLMAAIYYQDCYLYVQEYMDDEVALLSYFTCLCNYEDSLEYIERYSRDVLSTIIAREPNFFLQFELLDLYDLSLMDGQDKKVVLERLKTEDVNRLLNESYRKQDEFMNKHYYI